MTRGRRPVGTESDPLETRGVTLLRSTWAMLDGLAARADGRRPSVSEYLRALLPGVLSRRERSRK
jgi:hypothetical protein